MAVGRLQSDHFPYLPLTLTIGPLTEAFEALLDTGFDGDLAVPLELIPAGQPPDEYRTWELADGSEVATPIYYGTVRVGAFEPISVDVVAIGDAPLVGRGASDHYGVYLDHGVRVVIEP